MILLSLSSSVPDVIGKRNFWSLSDFENFEENSPFDLKSGTAILMLPSVNIETILAWLFNIWNSPSVPGTVTDVTPPLNKWPSGDTISNNNIVVIYIVVGYRLSVVGSSLATINHQPSTNYASANIF